MIKALEILKAAEWIDNACQFCRVVAIRHISSPKFNHAKDCELDAAIQELETIELLFKNGNTVAIHGVVNSEDREKIEDFLMKLNGIEKCK